MNADPILETDPQLTPLAVAPDVAAKIAGVGRTTIYASIASGQLRSLKIGNRRLIMVEWIREWLASAEQSSPEGSGNAR